MEIRIVLTGVLNAFSIDSAVYYESKAVLTDYLDLFATVEQVLGRISTAMGGSKVPIGSTRRIQWLL